MQGSYLYKEQNMSLNYKIISNLFIADYMYLLSVFEYLIMHVNLAHIFASSLTNSSHYHSENDSMEMHFCVMCFNL